MALDFPSSPAEGQVYRPYNGVPNYIHRSGTWIRKSGTASPFNRIVNPAMQVSQENGDTASLSSTTGSWYAADQWYSTWTVGNVARAQRTRLAGIGDYIFFNITGGVAIPAGGLICHLQSIEGNRVSDFQWGTASAKPAVLRFDAYASVTPGTYTIAIRNGNFTRSYLAPFTIAATGAWQTFVIPIPGDTTGTWAKDNTAGMSVSIVFDAGTTYGSGVAGWQAGNHLAIAGATHGALTTGIFRLTKVGFYLDPNNTGLAPEFEAPKIEEVITECQRYWYRMYNLRGVVTAATTMTVGGVHPVPLRLASPAYSVVGAMRAYDYTTAPAVSSVARTSAFTGDDTEFYGVVTTATGLTVGRPGGLITDSPDIYIAVNARM